MPLKKISETAKPFWDPAEIESNPWANFQEKITAVGNNAYSIVQLIMDLNPSLSYEQATEQLQKNRAEKRSVGFMGGGGDVAGATAATLPPPPEQVSEPIDEITRDEEVT